MGESQHASFKRSSFYTQVKPHMFLMRVCIRRYMLISQYVRGPYGTDRSLFLPSSLRNSSVSRGSCQDMEELTLAPMLVTGDHVLDKESLLPRQWFSNGDLTASVLPFVAIVAFFLFGWLFQLWLLLRVADESFLHHRHRFRHHRHRWGAARTEDWDDDYYYQPEDEDWDTTSTYASNKLRKRRIRRPSYTD